MTKLCQRPRHIFAFFLSFSLFFSFFDFFGRSFVLFPTIHPAIVSPPTAKPALPQKKVTRAPPGRIPLTGEDRRGKTVHRRLLFVTSSSPPDCSSCREWPA